MPVEAVSGPNFEDGTTWHQMVWVTSKVARLVPCYEIEWDAARKPMFTGRHALLTAETVAASQRKANPSGPWVTEPHLEGERLITHDEAVAEMHRINNVVRGTAA